LSTIRRNDPKVSTAARESIGRVVYGANVTISNDI
jgi:hypothetical protein